VTPRDIARAIDRAEGRPEERLVNVVTLRSMRQARYEAVSRGHFALAFDCYTHFTSPIRRYADLVVHRALKALLDEAEAPERRDRLRLVAGRLSWLERVAMEAEREMRDLVQCAFMAPRVDEEFDGTVTGVARHGLYVTLDRFFVEGLIHVSRLPGYLDFDEARHMLVARRSGERFHLGDRLRVLLASVDQIKARIDFALVRRLDQSAANSRSSSSSVL
jgi:ribonuclease R